MKTSSAKAKGRKLQQWFTKVLIEGLNLNEEDLESRPMGSQGEDIIMGHESREQFPYSIECKNQEALNIWKSHEQAEENCGDHTPCVVYKRNRSKTYISLEFDEFIKILKGN